MKNDYPEDRDANLRLLRAAREQYESMRVAISATVKRLQVGEELPTIKDVNGSINEFRKSIQSVITIEADLAKRSYEQRSGGEGACALDLEAARREIIERLITLAEPRTGGGAA